MRKHLVLESRQAANGSGAANDFPKSMACIIIKYRPLLIHIAMRFRFRQGDIDDICQEIFFKAWLKRSQFMEGSNYTAWIATIARSVCCDMRSARIAQCRDERRLENAAFHGLRDVRPHSCNLNYCATEFFKKAEWLVSDWLKVAIGKLSRENARLFLEETLNGRTQVELAKELAVSLNSVKMRLHRVKVILRTEHTIARHARVC